MDQFPPELVDLFFNELNELSKLNFFLVCKYFHSVASKKVKIISNYRQMKNSCEKNDLVSIARAKNFHDKFRLNKWAARSGKRDIINWLSKFMTLNNVLLLRGVVYSQNTEILDEILSRESLLYLDIILLMKKACVVGNLVIVNKLWSSLDDEIPYLEDPDVQSYLVQGACASKSEAIFDWMKMHIPEWNEYRVLGYGAFVGACEGGKLELAKSLCYDHVVNRDARFAKGARVAAKKENFPCLDG